jgi:hypothetical protein
MITKLFPILFLLFSFNTFSQNVSEMNIYDFLKGYEVQSLSKVLYIDSATIISKVMLKGATFATYKDANFITYIDYENNSFVTKKYDDSELKESITSIPNYFKINKVIYRIRIERNKQEYSFFKDEFNGDKFLLSENPFFKGLETDGYTFNAKVKFFNDNILFINEFKDFKNNTLGPVTRIKFTFFDNNFNFVSDSLINIAKESWQTLIKYEKINQDFFINYYEYDKKTEKLKPVIYRINDKKLFLISGLESEENINSITFFNIDDQFYLYSLKMTNEQWISQLYSINESQLTFVNDMEFKVEDIKKDFDSDIKLKNFTRLDYSMSDVYFYDNDVYIVTTAGSANTNYGSIYSNFLITKISESEIYWNQFIKRSGRTYDYGYYKFEVNNDQIEIFDKERKLFFDKNDNYIQGKDKYKLLPNFLDIKYILNKNNGQFVREVIR